MTCDFYHQDRCHSCSWLDLPYSDQLLRKEKELHILLEPFDVKRWFDSIQSTETGFRNKAKMQVLGFAHEPILGIINHHGEEVSLCKCPLYPPSMQNALQRIERWIKEAGLTPYKIEKKKGELKYILLTQAPHSGEMMLRFVLRSHQAIERIENYLDLLRQDLPALEVISANIQPVHMAILEGDEEIFLSQSTELKTRLNDVPLYIRPKSFFQTNSAVASQLYATARQWVGDLEISHMWDLFCGVGGFGLHCANESMQLTGIEIEAEAIACAKLSALELGLEKVSFQALDSTLFAVNKGSKPDLVLVNPPRRGLGEELSQSLNESDIAHILYSSCNAQTLVADLAVLTGYSIQKVQLFDMFAHTPHYEVLLLLTKN